MPIASVNDSSADPSSQPFLPGDQARGGRPAGCVSRGRIWTGRVLTALTTLFLLVDALGKLVMPPQVAQASLRLGMPMNMIPGIGVLLLICTVLYVFPRTAVLGAILTTGYLGGAVAIQMRVGSPLFETVFPVIIAVLVWTGIYLRDIRLCAMLPFRR